MQTIPLSNLKLNSTGVIKELNCKSNIKRRLLDLGLIPNTEITPIMVMKLGILFLLFEKKMQIKF